MAFVLSERTYGRVVAGVAGVLDRFPFASRLLDTVFLSGSIVEELFNSPEDSWSIPVVGEAS